jgi:hypothetical protein
MCGELWTGSRGRATFVCKCPDFVAPRSSANPTQRPGVSFFRPTLSTRRMQRTLEPELLDSLPHDHPDALQNRRDLRLTNRIMGNHRWLERTLPRIVHPGEVVLELGAGAGELGLCLARKGLAIAGLDLWPRPTEWNANLAWHREDLRTFDRYSDYAAIVGNLIFHQFSDADLAQVGEKLRCTARVIVASEPQRRRMSQFLYRAFTPLIGANHVSRHDGHVSIAAGFRGDELPRALGLARDEWRIDQHSTALGAYRMIAVRIT